MIRKLFEKYFFKKNTENNNLKQSIETVLDNDSKGTEGISKHERLMLLNILKIDGIRSSDIMIPRADIGAVELNDSFEKVLEVFIKEAHSRVPIYEKNLDNIIGMIHIKDLVNYQNQKKTETNFLQNLKREILEIPPSMPVLDLLLKMQLTRLHMGIVIDEYGCTDGLVTIEDVMIALLHGTQLHRNHIRPGPRFRHGKRAKMFARDQFGQVFFTLSLRSIELDLVHAEI